MCSSLTGSTKQSDIGSFGSSFQASKVDTSENVALTPSHCESPKNGRVGLDTWDEVNSPAKNLPTGIIKSVGPPIGDDIAAHPAKTVVTVVTSSATEGLTFNFKPHLHIF
jgi:hypothetical protein